MTLHNPTTEATVPTSMHGQRIDVALAQLFPDYSRSQLTQWLKKGFITVDNASKKPKESVLGGECIRMNVQSQSLLDAPCLPENIPLNVAFEDEDLLIINKPAGLVVHPGAGNTKHTLVNALLHHDESLHQLPRAGIVHRLDKDTSGLLMVGKTYPAYTALVRSMQARAIQRRYLTLVHGHVIAGATIETNYGRHPHNRLKMAVCLQGKSAITHYQVQTRYQGVTLLEVKLMTGRTHQIRVHMAHIHHPVIGDPLYGHHHLPKTMGLAAREALQTFKRQALHATSLSLHHPITDEPIEITAPLPYDMQLLLTHLEEETHV